ncbi:SMP-30/gluconolactonase/LRE family protein [Microbulbifer sp. S227A]|uniref:SMP-30/gluconolactonase/LRE family protein n=1 Tax=Microbulbifer sp. S227A TaxID=3415131 RepID=UPI003C7BAF37
MTGVAAFDPRACTLGEGPLWHPERQQLFWFDINAKRLLSRVADTALEWQFDRHVSAAGWVDRDRLLVASETDLFLFDMETGTSETLCPLEAEQIGTRSNDGRADPWGGFWIGTMDKHAAPRAGAIYRFYKGELHPLIHDLTIPNAICFSPDRKYAYYTDTTTRQIMRQRLKAEGWPTGPAEVFVDLRDRGLNPDGAVVDAEGCLWNAQWGASRVARYSPDGRELMHVDMPATQMTCPSFGGPDFATLYATSAQEGIDLPSPEQGQTHATPVAHRGLPEYRVIL